MTVRELIDKLSQTLHVVDQDTEVFLAGEDGESELMHLVIEYNPGSDNYVVLKGGG